MKSFIPILATVAFALTGPVYAQENINLTIASSHPTVVPWVGMIQTHFMGKTDDLLAETGNYKINWNEAFGGQLYKANATLSSVEDGITDIGWVFSFLEPAQLPLSQVSTSTPFAVTDVPALLDVMEELFESNEAFRKEWEDHNVTVLGLTATDLYDIYSKIPINGIADISGKKISAPGILGTWLRGTGANAVDGALTTFYTDIQTGVSDGVLSLALGVLPIKIHEVAPYIARFDAAAAFSGAIAINTDVWNTLPEEVQTAMRQAGAYYTESHGEAMVTDHNAALDHMVALGADQNPPVSVTQMSTEERQKWVDALPNLAKEWADPLDARGIPAGEFLKQYMAGLRSKHVEPSRAWDEEL
jgi:TRAP-type C4-dicarboxylate transport system substrate-binding protein